MPIDVQLERESGAALHLQLAQQVRSAALSGVLPSGTRLPGSRTLAGQLGVARGVVVDAYAELLADGTLEAVIGSGTRVAGGLRLDERQALQDAPAWWPDTIKTLGVSSSPAIRFTMGQPSLALLDVRMWRKVWAEVGRTPPPEDYGDAAGEPELRSALAAFVGRTRGHALTPGQVIVTSGAAQGFNLLASLLPPGAVIATEDPGYSLVRQIFAGAGQTVCPCRVDEGGLVVEELPPQAKLIYVTPSHQYPLGVRMSLPRRLKLLEWANQHDALIVEDDYDGEFRYDAAPLPALASLDTAGRVIYVGTLSKVLTPSLRLGYLGVPLSLAAALVEAKRLSDLGSPWAVQRAAAALLLGGHLDQHLRRVRRHYAAQRSMLGALLAPLFPHAVLGGIEAGLHACLHLAAPLNAAEVAADLRARDVEVVTLADYSVQPCGEALLLGYGGLTRAELERGARLIAEVVRERVG
ncbi:PLP-dependent aminotransferase family protein [Deinococcus sp.]|uniref:MocR-like pyridoxine biosynthesis transcription factor PdxR n=1 Tax=Deinococcus sp. TaxID=47478 RepID=UPI003B5C9A43